MDANSHSLNWFEIPVTDFERGKNFYESIFEIEMATQEMMGNRMAFFPWEMGSGKVAGAVCQGEGYKPSMDGAILYLNAGSNIQGVLDRVEEAGGQILMPKMQISPEIGFMAMFRDSEGNRVALHGNG